jgi:hypothetical protein
LIWDICRYRAAKIVKRTPRLEKHARTCISQMSSLRAKVMRDGVLGSMRSWAVLARRRLFDNAEFSFLEGVMPDSVLRGAELQLHSLSMKLLAQAAMEYEQDGDTVQYLLRSAKRLQSGSAEGFALVNADGTPVHFCWAAPFEGFWMAELNRRLTEPTTNAMLLFDSWTPGLKRGRGFFTHCVSLVAARMLQSGRRPWIASTSTNLGRIGCAGFVPRFAFVRKKKLFFSRVEAFDLQHNMMSLHPAA